MQTTILTGCEVLSRRGTREWQGQDSAAGIMPVRNALVREDNNGVHSELHPLDHQINTRLNQIAGVIRATVTDRVTLGHPCCAIHDRQNPLKNQCHIYCPNHTFKSDQCSVIECDNAHDLGWRTCALPEHRRLEEYQKLQGKATFQLKQRLQRVKVSQVHDAVALPAAPETMYLSGVHIG
jgi:hypothetical protein